MPSPAGGALVSKDPGLTIPHLSDSRRAGESVAVVRRPLESW